MSINILIDDCLYNGIKNGIFTGTVREILCCFDLDIVKATSYTRGFILLVIRSFRVSIKLRGRTSNWENIVALCFPGGDPDLNITYRLAMPPNIRTTSDHNCMNKWYSFFKDT